MESHSQENLKGSDCAVTRFVTDVGIVSRISVSIRAAKVQDDESMISKGNQVPFMGFYGRCIRCQSQNGSTAMQ